MDVKELLEKLPNIKNFRHSSVKRTLQYSVDSSSAKRKKMEMENLCSGFNRLGVKRKHEEEEENVLGKFAKIRIFQEIEPSELESFSLKFPHLIEMLSKELNDQSLGTTAHFRATITTKS